jgi:putative two-component system response regulator
MSERKSIVVVDDDPDIVEFVTSVLSPFYNVRIGCCSSDCFKLVEDNPPDMILLDVIMAHLSDGLDCLRRLKESPKTNQIPVVMIARVNEIYDYRSQIDASHFNHDRWLDKPVKPDVLLQTVREVLGD